MSPKSKKNTSSKYSNGPSARRFLITLLGEFLRNGPHKVWNSALIEAMKIAGQSEQASRQAVLRAASAGWLEKSVEGRRVKWTLTPSLLTFLVEGWNHVYPVNRASWDGHWLILHVSLPDKHRAARDKLYKSLHWAGFGNPSPGLWVSPYTENRNEIKRTIRALNLVDVTFCFIGQAIDIGINDQRLVQKCWDWDAISLHYEQLLARFLKLKPRTEDEIFVTHLQLLIEWSKLPLIDPRLPNSLLPANWTGHHSAAELEHLLVEWRRVAIVRWMEIVAKAEQS